MTSSRVLFSVMYICSTMPLCASHSSLVCSFGALLCSRGGTCGGGDGDGGGSIGGKSMGGKPQREAVASRIS